MDENNEQQKSAIEQGIDAGKKAAKNKTKKAIFNFIKPIIPYIITGVLIFFACLLVVGLTMAIQKVVFDTLTSVFNIFNSENTENQIFTDESKLLYISEEEGEKGAYKLVDKDLAKKIREELERQKVDNEVLGLGEDVLEETLEELNDMLNKYIKADVQTTYPKTSHEKNDLDGIICIKRVSSETGTEGKPLRYTDYDNFRKMLKGENSEEALEFFSLNPETFELCVAKHKSVTIYEYFDGTTKSEGGGIVEEVIDYKKYTENYSTPLNFFLALHLISQDVDFMGDFLELVLGDANTSLIEMTYIDGYSLAETEYIYSGTISSIQDFTPDDNPYTVNPDMISEEQFNELKGKRGLNHSEILHYYNDIREYKKKTTISYSGKLYVTKANTWIKTIDREVTDANRPATSKEGKPNNVYKKSSSQMYTVEDAQTGEVSNKKLTTTVIINQQTNTRTEGVKYTAVYNENEIKVDKFIELIKKYPKVENNLKTAPSNLFYLLQQNENTYKLERVMRYVLYELSGVNYGVSKKDLEELLAESFSEYNKDTVGLSQYLSQFSQGVGFQAPKSADGNYYQMYGYASGKASPIIGNADIQWESHYQFFNNVSGKIMHNGTIKKVDDVAQYINKNCFNGNPEAIYTKDEIEAMQIYIEKKLVDQIVETIQQSYYDYISDYMYDVNFSRQQIFALIALSYNYDTLPEIDGKSFSDIYLEASQKYEEKTWKHNMYVWDNWWCKLGKPNCKIPGYILAEATFETYIKGIFDYSASTAGGLNPRNYLFYTEEQLKQHNDAIINRDDAEYNKILRNNENEEKTFETIESNGRFVKDYKKISLGYWISTTGRTFTILNQYQIDDWGTKCNRAACAIIASGYSSETASALIDRMNENYNNNIIPTTEEYWHLYGLEKVQEYYGHMSVDKYTEILREHLQNGGYAAIWFNPNKHLTDKGYSIEEIKESPERAIYWGESGTQWTSIYHWVAVIDYKVEDGEEFIAIGDGHGAAWYSITEFIHGIDQLALIKEK